MCQQHGQCQGQGQSHGDGTVSKNNDESSKYGGPFPWSAGVFDAHCHPTDTMASFDDLPHMRAAVLTIMATRSQDQDLVAEKASSTLAVQSRKDLDADASPTGGGDQDKTRIIPSFGWHPWFSHQIFDDSIPPEQQTYRPSSDGNDRKAKYAHYAAVLTPAPDADDADDAFLNSLPEPTPLSSLISATRSRLSAHPLALVGEIGLDKAFRLPQAFKPDEQQDPANEGLTPGGREGRLLSPQHVRMEHQIAVLKAQLALAGELGRAVSVHGVQAHGVLFDALAATWKGHEKEVLSRREKRRIAPGAEDFWSSSSSEDEDEEEGGASLLSQERKKKEAKDKGQGKPYPPRICLHSFSGAGQMAKQYLHPSIPARIFFSFSTAINLGTEGASQKFEEVLKACPDDRILVESDLHTAGEDMDAALESMYRKVCQVKGWELEQGVRKIGENYQEFIFG